MKQAVISYLFLFSLAQARPFDSDVDNDKRAPPFVQASSYSQGNLQAYLNSLGSGQGNGGSSLGVNTGVSGQSSLITQSKALAGVGSGSQSPSTCPTACLSCDITGHNCVCNCATAEELSLIQGAIVPTVETAITNATQNLSTTIQTDLAALPCSQVLNLQNPSFERGDGELDGWDIYIQPSNSTNSYVELDHIQFFPDSYSGIHSPTPKGHSAHITVKGGEAVQMFNVITGLCPNSSIVSAIQVMTTDTAPNCDVYFGMVPALANPTTYYPAKQTTNIQTLFTAAGTGHWFNLTQTDTMNANTTSGALVFAVNCNSTAFANVVANYWIDYAFFSD